MKKIYNLAMFGVLTTLAITNVPKTVKNTKELKNINTQIIINSDNAIAEEISLLSLKGLMNTEVKKHNIEGRVEIATASSVANKIELVEESIKQIDEEKSIPYYDIPLSKELQEFTYNLIQEYGSNDIFNEKLIYAVIMLESNFNPNLISKTNDYGLMQINKINHKQLSKELGINNFLDPQQNIKAGTYILYNLTEKYQDKGVHWVLTAYNRGERGAKKHLASRGTSGYSRGVVENFNKINKIEK